MSYSIRLTRKARENIQRLYGYLLQRDKRAATRAYSAIEKGIASLSDFPFSCRKADTGEIEDTFLREMLIPFGDSGYIVLFEIEDAETVTILAIRHQREDDYH
jgi:plasmid stabilization system protein ParE